MTFSIRIILLPQLKPSADRGAVAGEPISLTVFRLVGERVMLLVVAAESEIQICNPLAHSASANQPHVWLAPGSPSLQWTAVSYYKLAQLAPVRRAPRPCLVAK